MVFAVLAALVLLPAFPGIAQEQVTVTEGSMQIIEIPFAIKGFRVADTAAVKAETLGDRKLRVLGLKAGTTDLQVTGEGGVAEMFTITVIENIKAVLGAMIRDLDTVPEVELTVNLGRVVIKGEVSSIDNWNLLQKVAEAYKGQTVNLAVFRPAPEVMLGLKSSLEKAGFTVVTGEDPADPGVLSVKFSGNTVFIGGSLYSQGDMEKVSRVIEAENWLVVVSDDEGKDNQGMVRALLNIEIVPTMIELDAIFVGVTEEENKQIGVNLAKAGLAVIDTTAVAFSGIVGEDRDSGYAGSYTINSGLQGALKFFTGSGPGRMRNAGHMTFKNDSPDWRTYHSGGTLKIRTATEDTVGLDDIDYGLIMRVRGGLLDAETASLDVNLELSFPVPVGNDYDLKRNRIETTVNCPLGQTLVMGGMDGLLEQYNQEGVPFLRSIPVIQWFFAEKNQLQQEQQVLILMSPQIAGRAKARPPVSLETEDTEDRALQPIRERQYEKRKRRFFFF